MSSSCKCVQGALHICIPKTIATRPLTYVGGRHPRGWCRTRVVRKHGLMDSERLGRAMLRCTHAACARVRCQRWLSPREHHPLAACFQPHLAQMHQVRCSSSEMMGRLDLTLLFIADPGSKPSFQLSSYCMPGASWASSTWNCWAALMIKSSPRGSIQVR